MPPFTVQLGIILWGHVCTVAATGSYRFETLVGKRNNVKHWSLQCMTCLLHPTGSMKTCEKHVRRFQCIDVWLLCYVCSACAALAARASDDFGLVVAANTTIFVYSLDLIRILIVASSWRDVRRAWQQPPRGPWLKMGWQLSGVWWTIMDHVTSSWTVIFACHFHHNYNGTTSRDSNVEYLRRRVRGWKKPWHVPTHDGLSMLPRHLLIPPDLSPWHLWSAAMQIPNL